MRQHIQEEQQRHPKWQPPTLNSLVRRRMSAITSSKQMRLGGAIEKQAAAVRERYSPAEITAAYPIDLQTVATSKFETVDQCEALPSPMIGAVQAAYIEQAGYDVALEWMKGQMVAVSKFVNVAQKMDEWQLASLCRQMMGEAPEIRLCEFVLFCARLRSGRYGRFYGMINPTDIIAAFDKFRQERAADLGRKWKREEEERIAREDAEHAKQCISYEEWTRRKEAARKNAADARKEETP